MFNRLVRKVKSTFVKNIIMITGGTVFAQVLNMVLLPLITRLYSPDQYGVLSVFTSILAMICLFGSFNYEMGIPIAENDEKAINVFALSTVILILFVFFLSIILLLWGDPLLSLLNGDVLVDYKYLLSIGVLFAGSYHILTQWAYRRKNFKAITKTKFTQPISQNLMYVLFGLFGKGAVGLILGRILGQSAGIVTLSHPLVRKDKVLWEKIRKHELLHAMSRFNRFALYTTPRRFLGEVVLSVPILFIATLYGTQVAGLYGLANGVIHLPMSVVGSSVSNVFYAESASLRTNNPKRIKELSNKLLKYLFIIGIVSIVILVLFGRLLFSFVFGSAWAEAGIFAALLSIGVFSRLIFRPISNIFDIFEKQKTALIINIFGIIFVLIVFGVSSYFSLNSYWAVGLYSVAMALIYFIQYILAQKVLNDAILKDTSKQKMWSDNQSGGAP